MTAGLAELPPRVGVAIPADYRQLDLTDPRYAWARRVGVRSAALSRRGAGTPAEPASFIQLTVAVVRDWSVGRAPAPSDVDARRPSTVQRAGAAPPGVPAGCAPAGSAPAVPAEPAGDGDWLRPPAYLLVNGLPAAQLLLERRLRLPDGAGEIRSLAAEVLVPLPGSGHVVVVTATTTYPGLAAEAEWTALAVAGTLAYRPAGRPRPRPDPAARPVPELRVAGPSRPLAPPGPGSPGPPRGTIGQAAVDQLAGLVATHDR